MNQGQPIAVSVLACVLLALGCARSNPGPALPRELGLSHETPTADESGPAMAGSDPAPGAEPSGGYGSWHARSSRRPPAAYVSSTSPHRTPVAAHIKMPGGYGTFQIVGGGAFPSPGAGAGSPGQPPSTGTAAPSTAGMTGTPMQPGTGGSMPPGGGPGVGQGAPGR